MRLPSPFPRRPLSVLQVGVTIAAAAVFAIGIGAIVWGLRDPNPPATPGGFPPPSAGAGRQLPTPVDPSQLPFHTVTFTEEKGRRVVIVRVVAQGDDLVIDAATGRLIETRANRPGPPQKKGAAPFTPRM